MKYFLTWQLCSKVCQICWGKMATTMGKYYDYYFFSLHSNIKYYLITIKNINFPPLNRRENNVLQKTRGRTFVKCSSFFNFFYVTLISNQWTCVLLKALTQKHAAYRRTQFVMSQIG